MEENKLLERYCEDYDTMVSPIDILQRRIAELESENEFLCNQYNDLIKQNKELQKELNNFIRVD